MKEIPLTQEQVTLVDDEDFEYLNQFKWQARWSKNTKSFYAIRSDIRLNGKRRIISMARVILGLDFDDKRLADHRNHETLLNTRENLRICTSVENQQNSVSRKGASKYKGVTWHGRNKKWDARIRVNGKQKYLGSFKHELHAVLAYDWAAIKYFGEFAHTNFNNSAERKDYEE